MFEVIIIVLAFGVLFRSLNSLEPAAATSAMAPGRNSARIAQMSDYADRLYSEKKWLAAEKAYLGVLKLDHKNVTAYVHLGIIYSTQKNLPDAIECFQIAARLRPSGVTFQNLGLAYFDNHNYIKSIAAFEKAIMLEPSATRYVGLSKAQNKLKDYSGMTASLEKAAGLESSKKILALLLDAYVDAERHPEAEATRRRLREP